MPHARKLAEWSMYGSLITMISSKVGYLATLGSAAASLGGFTLSSPALLFKFAAGATVTSWSLFGASIAIATPALCRRGRKWCAGVRQNALVGD